VAKGGWREAKEDKFGSNLTQNSFSIKDSDTSHIAGYHTVRRDIKGWSSTRRGVSL
jgi:hypothetical protein